MWNVDIEFLKLYFSKSHSWKQLYGLLRKIEVYDENNKNTMKAIVHFVPLRKRTVCHRYLNKLQRLLCNLAGKETKLMKEIIDTIYVK